MRCCKINGCKSKGSDTERCLFKIENGTKSEWIQIIQRHQTLDKKKAIYVCDLHFHESDLRFSTIGKCIGPKKNAVPLLGNFNRLFQNNDISSDRDISCSIDSESSFESSSIVIDTSTVTISNEVYQRLLKASTDVYKANDTIEKLKDTIRKKDAKIEEIQKECSVLKRNAINWNQLSIVQREVLGSIINRPSNSRQAYSKETRQFCLRIQFHSSAAYNELRKFTGNRLPPLRTLRKYLQSTDASPGITQAAIDEIAQKVREYKEKGEKLYLAAMSDDISIKRHISFNENTTKFNGFPSEVSSQAKGPPSAAKEALVFMVTGPDFKIPVAYFLLNGLAAVDRAVLTKQVLIAIQNTGARIISLTGDGLRANITVLKLLGVDFSSNQPHFVLSSRPNEKIYPIFDPPHMLKLIRRYFAYHELYYKGDRLKWEVLEKLADKQDNDNFELGNKLSRDHINFKIAPMNVAYAAQAMSNGVADAIEQLCEDEYEDFIGSESTVEFIRLVNNVFDVQNYGDGKPKDEHFKQPLCEATINKFRELFQKFEDFVSHLEVNEYQYQKKKKIKKMTRKHVLKSRISVGFLGFLTNIKSILGIYTDYIQSGLLKEFSNFQFSQDHLETYFSLIRSALGWNNNPNELQLMAAYRRSLVCMPHLSARGGNCILNSTNVLTVSSTQPKVQQASQPSFDQIEVIEIDPIQFHDLLNVEVEPYEQHMRAITASTVEQNIIKKIAFRSKSTCQDCLCVFGENTKIVDTLIAKKQKTKQITQPCVSTFDIISACNVVNQLLQSRAYVDIHVVAKTTLCMLDTDEMYDKSFLLAHQQDSASQSCNLTHKDEFVYAVIKEYLCMKSKKIGKRITIEEQKGRALRRKLTRSIIVAGQ